MKNETSPRFATRTDYPANRPTVTHIFMRVFADYLFHRLWMCWLNARGGEVETWRRHRRRQPRDNCLNAATNQPASFPPILLDVRNLTRYAKASWESRLLIVLGNERPSTVNPCHPSSRGTSVGWKSVKLVNVLRPIWRLLYACLDYLFFTNARRE